MARRRPPKTGITDWISDVTDVFRPGQRPGETRQATQFRGTTRNVVQTGAAAVDTTFAGGLAGSFYRNIQQPAATIGSPDVRSRAEREGLKAFGRDAAVTASTAAAGVGAAKVAGKAVSKVVESGVPARVANKLTGQRIVVVGTKSDPVVSRVVRGRPGSGLGDIVEYVSDRSVAPGKMLPTVADVVKEPQTIFAKLKNTPVRWGWDPSKSPSMTDLTKDVSEYSNRWAKAKLEPRKLSGGGQTLEYRGMYTPEIAVGKVKKRNLRAEPVMPNWSVTPEQSNAINEIFKGTGSPNNPVFRKGAVASTSPVKVVSTVSPVAPPKGKFEQYGEVKPIEQVQKELEKAIKRAGGKLPKKR